MNILITGSTGLLGLELVSELSRHHQVYAVTRNPAGAAIWKNNRSVTPVFSDLSDLQDTDLPNQIDAIYYLAQGRNFRDFPGSALETTTINTLSPVHLATWGLSHGATSFYYASTGGVYSSSPEPIRETALITCSSAKGLYPDSKFAAELLLRNYQNLFPSFAILRPFFMYGPLQEKNMLIPRLINNINKGEKIFLSGADGMRMNPIYVSDAARACARLLDTRGSHVFNLAGPDVVTLGEIIRIIGRKIRKDPIIERKNEPVNDLIADIEVMKTELAVPVVSVQEGISITADAVISGQ